MRHSTVKTEQADAYLKYIEVTGLSDYRNVKGNLSAKVLRIIEGTVSHFLTVTKWDSYESIKKIRGQNYEKAGYYSENKKYLWYLKKK